ncbi:MAG: DUF3854 domain-containing protein, partial [Pseudomonadota bacterium]
MSDETIQLAGIRSVTDGPRLGAALRWSAGRHPPVPGIWIPYDPARPSEYGRYRPDNPRTTKDGNRPKYEAPIDIPSRIYEPRWLHPEIDDQSVELWVTEGEKKALAMCQSGYACVGAPGVYQLHDAVHRKAQQAAGAKDEWRLHPDLAPLIQPGRRVVVCFDRDVDTNPNVHAALVRAVRMLTDTGAEVSVAYVSRVKKVKGVDDLLVALGGDVQRFRRCLDASKQPALPNDVIGWLRRRWVKATPKWRARELRRAVYLADQLLGGGDKYRMWREAVLTTLEGCKKLIIRAECKLLRLQARGSSSDGWFDAPGFFVIGKGEKTGVWKDPEERGKDPRPICSAPINIVGFGADETGAEYSIVRFKYGGEIRERVVP